MNITIEINTDGEAFENHPPFNDGTSSQLRWIFDHLVKSFQVHGIEGEKPLYDIHGNRCGTVTITESE